MSCTSNRRTVCVVVVSIYQYGVVWVCEFLFRDRENIVFNTHIIFIISLKRCCSDFFCCLGSIVRRLSSTSGMYSTYIIFFSLNQRKNAIPLRTKWINFFAWMLNAFIRHYIYFAALLRINGLSCMTFDHEFFRIIRIVRFICVRRCVRMCACAHESHCKNQDRNHRKNPHNIINSFYEPIEKKKMNEKN